MRWAWFALLVVTVAVYWPVHSAGFVYEDVSSVQVHLSDLARPTIGSLVKGRLISTVAYALNADYAPTAESFHLINLALHLGNGLLLGAWLVMLGLSPWAAWLAGACFLLHPLQVEAVAYVSGRTELLSTGFVLLALLALPRSWLLTTLALVCAVLSKESAVMGIVLVVLVAGLTDRLSWRHSFVALWVLAVLVTSRALSTLPDAYLWQSDRHGYGYLAVECAALWRMVGLFLVPVGFTVDHDFSLVTPLVGTLAVIGVLAWLGLAWRLRVMAPLAALALAWPVLALLPRFFLRIPEFLNEHQCYLPMVGVALLLACVWDALPREVAA